MGVSRDAVDRIKTALDPLGVIREAVPSLKAVGARWKGNCPFHNERTPSFYFQPDKGLWHCFGACQEGGDIISFVMKLEGWSFSEAVRELAHRAGVSVQWDRVDDPESRKAKERDRLLGLLDEAASFYRQSLRSLPEGEAARRYAVQRGLKPETLDRFAMGYAPRQNGFLDGALKKGTPIELLLRAGVAARSDRTGRYQDPLSGRLIFPIRDPYGQVVAFGGRVLESDGGPKYINSPETPVYTKGRQLFGLYEGRADLRARAQAVVVEGYMDVVGLHQAGIPWAVAPLGTALTSEQARLLRRYVQEAVLLFDPDTAGQNASWRSAGVFLKEDVFIRVAEVPGGKDPDEYVLAEGPESLVNLLHNSRDVVDFWLDRLAPALEDFNDLHGRLRRAEELVAFIAAVPNEALKEAWIRRTADRLSLDASALKRDMDRRISGASPNGGATGGSVGQGRSAGAGLTPEAVRREGPSDGKRRPAIRTVEEEVLQILSGAGALWESVNLDDALFADTRCLAVFRHWREQWRAHRRVDPGAAVAVLGADDVAWLSALLVEGKTFTTPVDALDRRIKVLTALAQKRECADLERRVLDMLEGRKPRDEEQILRYQNLTRLLRAAGTSDR